MLTSLHRIVRETIAHHARMFDQIEDPYFRERASDIRGLGRRILMRLESQAAAHPDYPRNTVLTGVEITASELAEVPEGKLAGVVSG